METRTRTQKKYDHRLKELVRSTQDLTCAVRSDSSHFRGIKVDPVERHLAANALGDKHGFSTRGHPPELAARWSVNGIPDGKRASNLDQRAPTISITENNPKKSFPARRAIR